MNTCMGMIVSVNKMQCSGKVGGGVGWGEVMGVRITMGRGAKAVSNLLMEAVAGRNMSMTTDRLMPGNANHRATVQNRGRDKGRSGRTSSMEYLEITSKKKKGKSK